MLALAACLGVLAAAGSRLPWVEPLISIVTADAPSDQAAANQSTAIQLAIIKNDLDRLSADMTRTLWLVVGSGVAAGSAGVFYRINSDRKAKQ